MNQVKRELWTILIRNVPHVFENTHGDYAYKVLVRQGGRKHWNLDQKVERSWVYLDSYCVAICCVFCFSFLCFFFMPHVLV